MKQQKCDYKQYDRKLTKKFIHGLENEGMISGILREVSPLDDINDASSKLVLLWAQRVESQGVQKEALDNI